MTLTNNSFSFPTYTPSATRSFVAIGGGKKRSSPKKKSSHKKSPKKAGPQSKSRSGSRKSGLRHTTRQSPRKVVHRSVNKLPLILLGGGKKRSGKKSARRSGRKGRTSPKKGGAKSKSGRKGRKLERQSRRKRRGGSLYKTMTNTLKNMNPFRKKA